MDFYDKFLPKVLVTENISSDGLNLLSSAFAVDECLDLTPEQLVEILPAYQALVIRSKTKVTSDVLRAGRLLRVVARAGVGVDNVDVDEATKLGVVVVNSPSGNTGAAAEHTIALMMSLARKVPQGCASLKNGNWGRNELVGVEVKGKTLAIIGLGKVGMTVARLANGLGMAVDAFDPHISPFVAASASVNLILTLPVLLASADFVTIHTPLIASTRGIISTAELALMKPGSRILNVARGGIVDEAALLAALESGHLAGAAVDVFTSEPPAADSTAERLIAHPNAVVTPHLGASTIEAQENVSRDVCEQVMQVLKDDLPRSAVNTPLILPGEYRKLQPFVPLVEKLGSLYTQYCANMPLGGSLNRSKFDLIYKGEITSVSNTKPLFAALIRGLISPIVSNGGANINMLNAEFIARERGIFVSERHCRDPEDRSAYSSLVTLIAHPPPNGSLQAIDAISPEPESQRVVSGTCSDGRPLITRIGNFDVSFKPEGTLLICENYDSPGKIGAVCRILDQQGVKIHFMTVAPGPPDLMTGIEQNTSSNDGTMEVPFEKRSEALMIIGVDRDVPYRATAELVIQGAALSACAITF
ncbi:hypothetical protein N7495_004340 [Penicillium taxi]|uniref:uncharacterized protein n=1 Tax=Penicillium taxi TaxID=168475 RepID=UPI00254501D0|nr:uncharacterized protein N7495_004340 [Penicillium taxi]KAJ5899596.1 hypothetical protein N7495_004340 [Penicillium taxi]